MAPPAGDYSDRTEISAADLDNTISAKEPAGRLILVAIPAKTGMCYSIYFRIKKT